MNEAEKIYNLKEAVAEVQVGKHTIMRWAKEMEEYITVGRFHFYTEANIQAFKKRKERRKPEWQNEKD